jgi:L-iditol 2-dehydrogenase
MQAARIIGPTTFEVVETPVPRLSAPGEILLRTAACGICSGDLMPWYLEKKVGTVLGHEIVGWAAEAGAGAKHIQRGDLVFVHHHAPCLACDNCRRGHFVHCSTWRQSRLDPGGMAEWIRVPAVHVQNDCFTVNDLTPDQAVFIEPLACSVKALERVGKLIDLGDRSTCGVVVGCGVMGLLNLAAARAMGVPNLIAVEPNEQRRGLAPEWGADRALTPAEADSGLKQSADFVMIGPGRPEIICRSSTYLRPGGAALLFTPTPASTLTSLDLGELYFREISLVPSYSCGPPDTRSACELIRSKRVRPQGLVTHRFRLPQVQEAYETARRGGAALKVLVTFPRENES